MRIVLDTNTLVSALLSRGASYRLVQEIVGRDDVRLATSPALLSELAKVLGREKLRPRLAALRTTPAGEIRKVLHIATLFRPTSVPRVVPNDPDDDHVIACALAARADLIVSWDTDLLMLGRIDGITIVTPAEALDRLASGG